MTEWAHGEPDVWCERAETDATHRTGAGQGDQGAERRAREAVGKNGMEANVLNYLLYSKNGISVVHLPLQSTTVFE